MVFDTQTYGLSFPDFTIHFYGVIRQMSRQMIIYRAVWCLIFKPQMTRITRIFKGASPESLSMAEKKI